MLTICFFVTSEPVNLYNKVIVSDQKKTNKVMVLDRKKVTVLNRNITIQNCVDIGRLYKTFLEM